jgi:glycosyltransferase involved in cell wall biosynthesis
MNMTDLDIVIPVYNEGKNILAVLESFQKSIKCSIRVLICFDHDHDDTLEAVRGCRDVGFEILPVKNRLSGVHGAIMTGFQASTALGVVVMPADDVHNAIIIDDMLERLRRGCDIVAPSRFMKGGCMVGCPWLKAVLVRSGAFILHHVAGVPTRDPSNGFRCFSRRVLNMIPVESSTGFTYSIELLVKCHRLRWRIEEVPSRWFERNRGVSRFRTFRWLPAYMRWVMYAFATTFMFKGPESVKLTNRWNKSVSG